MSKKEDVQEEKLSSFFGKTKNAITTSIHHNSIVNKLKNIQELYRTNKFLNVYLPKIISLVEYKTRYQESLEEDSHIDLLKKSLFEIIRGLLNFRSTLSSGNYKKITEKLREEFPDLMLAYDEKELYKSGDDCYDAFIAKQTNLTSMVMWGTNKEIHAVTTKKKLDKNPFIAMFLGKDAHESNKLLSQIYALRESFSKLELLRWYSYQKKEINAQKFKSFFASTINQLARIESLLDKETFSKVLGVLTQYFPGIGQAYLSHEKSFESYYNNFSTLSTSDYAFEKTLLPERNISRKHRLSQAKSKYIIAMLLSCFGQIKEVNVGEDIGSIGFKESKVKNTVNIDNVLAQNKEDFGSDFLGSQKKIFDMLSLPEKVDHPKSSKEKEGNKKQTQLLAPKNSVHTVTGIKDEGEKKMLSHHDVQQLKKRQMTYLIGQKPFRIENAKTFYQSIKKVEGGVTTYKFTGPDYQVTLTQEQVDLNLQRIKDFDIKNAVEIIRDMINDLRSNQIRLKDAEYTFIDDIYVTELGNQVLGQFVRYGKDNADIHINVSRLASQDKLLETFVHEFFHSVLGSSSSVMRNEGMAQRLTWQYIFKTTNKDIFDKDDDYTQHVFNSFIISNTLSSYNGFELFQKKLVYDYDSSKSRDVIENSITYDKKDAKYEQSKKYIYGNLLRRILYNRPKDDLDINITIFLTGGYNNLKGLLATSTDKITPKMKDALSTILHGYQKHPFYFLEKTDITYDKQLVEFKRLLPKYISDVAGKEPGSLFRGNTSDFTGFENKEKSNQEKLSEMEREKKPEKQMKERMNLMDETLQKQIDASSQVINVHLDALVEKYVQDMNTQIHTVLKDIGVQEIQDKEKYAQVDDNLFSFLQQDKETRKVFVKAQEHLLATNSNHWSKNTEFVQGIQDKIRLKLHQEDAIHNRDINKMVASFIKTINETKDISEYASIHEKISSGIEKVVRENNYYIRGSNEGYGFIFDVQMIDEWEKYAYAQLAKYHSFSVQEIILNTLEYMKKNPDKFSKGIRNELERLTDGTRYSQYYKDFQENVRHSIQSLSKEQIANVYHPAHPSSLEHLHVSEFIEKSGQSLGITVSPKKKESVKEYIESELSRSPSLKNSAIEEIIKIVINSSEEKQKCENNFKNEFKIWAVGQLKAKSSVADVVHLTQQCKKNTNIAFSDSLQQNQKELQELKKVFLDIIGKDVGTPSIVERIINYIGEKFYEHEGKVLLGLLLAVIGFFIGVRLKHYRKNTEKCKIYEEQLKKLAMREDVTQLHSRLLSEYKQAFMFPGADILATIVLSVILLVSTGKTADMYRNVKNKIEGKEISRAIGERMGGVGMKDIINEMNIDRSEISERLKNKEHNSSPIFAVSTGIQEELVKIMDEKGIDRHDFKRVDTEKMFFDMFRTNLFQDIETILDKDIAKKLEKYSPEYISEYLIKTHILDKEINDKVGDLFEKRFNAWVQKNDKLSGSSDALYATFLRWIQELVFILALLLLSRHYYISNKRIRKYLNQVDGELSEIMKRDPSGKNHKIDYTAFIKLTHAFKSGLIGIKNSSLPKALDIQLNKKMGYRDDLEEEKKTKKIDQWFDQNKEKNIKNISLVSKDTSENVKKWYPTFDETVYEKVYFTNVRLLKEANIDKKRDIFVLGVNIKPLSQKRLENKEGPEIYTLFKKRYLNMLKEAILQGKERSKDYVVRLDIYQQYLPSLSFIIAENTNEDDVLKEIYETCSPSFYRNPLLENQKLLPKVYLEEIEDLQKEYGRVKVRYRGISPGK